MFGGWVKSFRVCGYPFLWIKKLEVKTGPGFSKTHYWTLAMIFSVSVVYSSCTCRNWQTGLADGLVEIVQDAKWLFLTYFSLFGR